MKKDPMILPSNGALSTIDWIRQQAKRWGISVKQESEMYKLSPAQCAELGIPKQKRSEGQ